MKSNEGNKSGDCRKQVQRRSGSRKHASGLAFGFSRRGGLLRFISLHGGFAVSEHDMFMHWGGKILRY